MSAVPTSRWDNSEMGTFTPEVLLDGDSVSPHDEAP